jgi:hypothetical protein
MNQAKLDDHSNLILEGDYGNNIELLSQDSVKFCLEEALVKLGGSISEGLKNLDFSGEKGKFFGQNFG